MTRVKGNNFVEHVQRVRQAYGEEALANVLARMTPEHAQSIRAGIRRSEWYGYDLYLDYMGAVDRALGQGDGAAVRRITAESVDGHLNALLKVILTVFASPSDVARKTSASWRSFFDAGDMVVVEDSPRSLTLELRDFPEPHVLHCQAVLGFIERFTELASSRNRGKLSWSHPSCRAAGAATCRFEAVSEAR